MNESIIENAEYVHFKGGRYIVVGVALDATNAVERHVVVYRSIKESKLFVRNIAEFFERVAWPDGVIRPRFVPAELH